MHTAQDDLCIHRGVEMPNLAFARCSSIFIQPRSSRVVLRVALRSAFYSRQCCNAIRLDGDEPVESDYLEDVLNVWL